MSMTYNDFMRAAPPVGAGPSMADAAAEMFNLNRMKWDVGIAATSSAFNIGPVKTAIASGIRSYFASDDGLFGSLGDAFKSGLTTYAMQTLLSIIPENLRPIASAVVGALTVAGLGYAQNTHDKNDAMIQAQMAANPALQALDRNNALNEAYQQQNNNGDNIEDRKLAQFRMIT